VTAILRKTGGAKPNKTEGGKSFTAKALPPSFLECGGKRSATPLWIFLRKKTFKAPSPLHSAGALQINQIAADETPRLAD